MKPLTHLLCVTLVIFSAVGAAHTGNLQAPSPDDTLEVTATIPYNDEYGSGEAYVYLSDDNSVLTSPAVVVEGFDLDNNMNWEELYTFLNQANLIDSIHSRGIDIVVLNFDDATDYLQKNAFVVVELLQQIQSLVSPETDYVIAGASMGGLCCRYALAYMETYSMEHHARTFISFDSPHKGANVPVGIQYWLEFFSGLSDDAAHNLELLDRPASRQMLVYHHTDPPGSTGEADSLRAGFLTDLAAVGDWPTSTRLVAASNGSGYGDNQGFSAGAQIIDYHYSSLLVDIVGNIWSVPDVSEQMIFEGLIDIFLLPPTSMTVTVSGTRPYDSAPGGYRNTMAEMDSLTAPYGDIVALYPHHCFIPAVSALSVDTEDLFYDIAGDLNLIEHTPFENVYYPDSNQEHATITEESAQWFIEQVLSGTTDVKKEPWVPSVVTLGQNVPNPFNPSTMIQFTLSSIRKVRLSVYDVSGRLVTTLLDGPARAGTTGVVWDGTNAGGSRVSSGVYFCRLVAGEESRTIKMVLME
jgi:hypothetical protein